MLVPDAWVRVLGSRCLISGAWFRVLGSGAWFGCLVPCAWFRLTEYEVICYEKFVFNSLKRCYLWVLFLHVVFSLLFASFNFTKLQFIVVSSLMFFHSHSRSLFNDGFQNLCSVLSWFVVLGFGCLVPGGRFQVLGSGCLVTVGGIHGYLLETVRLSHIVTVGLSLMMAWIVPSFLSYVFDSHSKFALIIAFTTYSVSCWFRMLGSGCLVPGAWSRVLDSGCLVRVLGSLCLVPVDRIWGNLLWKVRL